MHLQAKESRDYEVFTFMQAWASDQIWSATDNKKHEKKKKNTFTAFIYHLWRADSDGISISGGFPVFLGT